MFIVNYANGRTKVECDTYAEAEQVIRDEYEDAEIGHDGDLSRGGDSTLCWADEESSRNDAGQHAVATISRAE